MKFVREHLVSISIKKSAMKTGAGAKNRERGGVKDNINDLPKA